ncbi:MAG: hypothetical protein P8Y71_07875 [Pseudolabrys sp.]
MIGILFQGVYSLPLVLSLPPLLPLAFPPQYTAILTFANNAGAHIGDITIRRAPNIVSGLEDIYVVANFGHADG